MRGKRYKLTLRDLGLTCISKKSAEVIVNWDTSRTTRRSHEQTKDRMLEFGNNIKELIEAKKKKESRNT